MAIHPIAIKNTFASHLVLWVLFLPLLSILFFPVFMKDQNIDPAEIQMVQKYGSDLATLTASSSSIFSAAFIKTGIMPATENFFGGGRSRTENSSEFGASSSHMAGEWVRGVWQLIYKVIWRINALVGIFIMPMFALCIPAAIDGFSVRARKKYRFENYNPVFFYTSTHTAVLMVGLFLYLPLVPIALTANILATFLVALACAIWVATSNFQTGS